MPPWWIHESRVKVIDMKGETSKDSTKGFPAKEDVIFEPAPWFQEHSSKKLKMSADPFGEAYTRKKCVEDIMVPDPVSNQSLSGYGIKETTVIIQEALDDTSERWDIVD